MFQLRARIAVLAVAAVFGAAAPAYASATIGSSTIGLENPHVFAQLNAAASQSIENIALASDGSAYVTFTFAAQVARIGRNGKVSVLQQFPAPPNGDIPGFHTKIAATGIVRLPDGTLYVSVMTGLADSTGVYRILPGQKTATKFASLPADAFLNGLALDPRGYRLFITDSVLSTIWSVPLDGGPVTAWLTAEALAPHGTYGANGLKVHDGAVWVTNTNDGTLLRIPIEADGGPGAIKTVATGLTGADDLIFPGRGDTALVALDRPSKIVAVAPDGHWNVLLTAQNGVANPTSLAIRGNTVYIDNAAFFIGSPTILAATLER